MEVVAVIQARWNASRFPGKVLAHLAGKPILKHVIDRVRKAQSVERLVVAVGDGQCHEAVVGHCEEWGVEWFLGPEENVLLRFCEALALQRDEDLCVRVCADNPLIWPKGIDILVGQATSDWTRPVYYGFRDHDGTPMITRGTGWFAEVVNVGGLRCMNRLLCAGDLRREHVTQAFYESDALVSCEWVDVPQWYLTHRPPDTAIDTPEDLVRVEEFLEEMDSWSEKGWPFK
jgi:spore coat polysaccharide biosynthesis protein SpsF